MLDIAPVSTTIAVVLSLIFPLGQRHDTCSSAGLSKCFTVHNYILLVDPHHVIPVSWRLNPPS